MAGIDKIYGTQAQYVELKEWLLANQVPVYSLVRWSSTDGEEYDYVLPTDRMYEDEGFRDDYRAIANFGEAIDVWLRENCPLEFVQARLKEQYGE